MKTATWKEMVMAKDSFFFTLREDQLDETGALVEEVTLYSSRVQALYHGKEERIFQVSTSDLNPEGFQAPRAPEGIVGISEAKWLERWYRGSSVVYKGKLGFFYSADPFDEVAEVKKIDLSKAYFDQGKGHFGLSQIVIPTQSQLGDVLTISLWGKDVSFTIGKSHVISSVQIEDGAPAVIKNLKSQFFANLLTIILVDENHDYTGIEVTGDLNEEMLNKLFIEFSKK